MTGLAKPVPCDLQLDVTNRITDYEVNFDVAGFTYVFGQIYLPIKQEWLNSFVRKYQVFIVNARNYYVVKAILKNNGVEIAAHGASFDNKVASDHSCYFLAQKLKANHPNFVMPRYLIGYPNLRGHCFLSSSVLPVLHIWPLVCVIFDESCNFQRLLHLGVVKDRSLARSDVETPYYWTDTFGRILRTYREMSVDGILPLNNCAWMTKYKFKKEEFQNISCIPVAPYKPYKDLKLDRSLIYGLAHSLSWYCHDMFKTPGGDERVAYCFFMRKLASEIKGFAEKFFVKISCTYSCRSCSGGPFTSTYHIPMIRIPFNTEFQSFIDDLDVLVQEQKFRSQHMINGMICSDEMRVIKDVKLLNLPRFLCIGVDNGNAVTVIDIPDKIKYRFNGQEHYYHRFANSVCFKTYTNAAKKYYGDFFHLPQEGDNAVGEHSYLHILTKKGWFAVNNGLLYTPDRRILNYVLQCTLHFYLLEEFMKYLPDINMKEVHKGPQI